MKVSKKQPNLSKKDENKRISAPKINAFFKTTPKKFVIDESNVEFANTGDSSKQFYIQALKKKLQGFNVQRGSENEDREIKDKSHQESGAHAIIPENNEHNDVSTGDHNSIGSNACAGCVQLTIEFNEWKTKSIEWEEKYKTIKKNYVKLAIHDSELGVKYTDLLKMATSTNRPDADEAMASNEDIFTQNQIRFFRSMPLDKNKDSSFILQCLEYAYKTDQSVLLKKTLKGKPEWVEITDGGEEICHPIKDPLTPNKVERIRELFIERVSKCNINLGDYGQRMKESYLNRLIASGIKNIAKKQK